MSEFAKLPPKTNDEAKERQFRLAISFWLKTAWNNILHTYNFLEFFLNHVMLQRKIQREDMKLMRKEVIHSGLKLTDPPNKLKI